MRGGIGNDVADLWLPQWADVAQRLGMVAIQRVSHGGAM